MLDSKIITFTIFAFVLAITPGSDTLLVIKNTLQNGRNAGWSTTFGVLSGTFFHAIISVIGLSVILMQSALAFQTVKTLGALYLIWLGIQTIWTKPKEDEKKAEASKSLWNSYGEGLLTNVLNPKVAVFYLAFLPQFITPGDPVVLKSILLAGIHNLLSLLWLGTLSVLIVQGHQWTKKPVFQQWASKISGILLIGLGIRLVFESKQ